MKYNGIELKEFTSDKPVVFDPPKKMLCWDNNFDVPKEQEVVAYLPLMSIPVFTAFDRFARCAELPEELKPRRATNRELSKWLVRGNGERIYKDDSEPDDGCFFVHTTYCYYTGEEDDIVPKEHFVRKWGDSEWHEPTADYMGLEG